MKPIGRLAFWLWSIPINFLSVFCGLLLRQVRSDPPALILLAAAVVLISVFAAYILKLRIADIAASGRVSEMQGVIWPTLYFILKAAVFVCKFYEPIITESGNSVDVSAIFILPVGVISLVFWFWRGAKYDRNA